MTNPASRVKGRHLLSFTDLKAFKMAENTKSFPMLPINHWFNLREKFKKSIPGSVSSTYLASTLSMAEGSAKANIIPSLRQIGLIGDDNKTNQDLASEFRDDAKYASFCKKIALSIYPQELLDAFPDTDSSKDQVKNWFSLHTKVGEVAARKMTAFYLMLLTSDIDKQTQVSKDSKTIKARDTVAKKLPSRDKNLDKIQSPKTSSGQDSDKNPDSSQDTKQLPSLNINIQVHLASDLSIEQIEQVFASMAKHLYK